MDLYEKYLSLAEKFGVSDAERLTWVQSRVDCELQTQREREVEERKIQREIEERKTQREIEERKNLREIEEKKLQIEREEKAKEREEKAKEREEGS